MADVFERVEGQASVIAWVDKGVGTVRATGGVRFPLDDDDEAIDERRVVTAAIGWLCDRRVNTIVLDLNGLHADRDSISFFTGLRELLAEQGYRVLQFPERLADPRPVAADPRDSGTECAAGTFVNRELAAAIVILLQICLCLLILWVRQAT